MTLEINNIKINDKELKAFKRQFKDLEKDLNSLGPDMLKDIKLDDLKAIDTSILDDLDIDF